MKRIALLILMTTLPLAQSMLAAGPAKWVRRLTAVGACAASMADLATTRSALAQGRGREGNPLMQSQARLAGFKVGLCGGSLILQEFTKHDKAATAVNVGQIGLFGWTAHHNSRVGR